MIEEMGYGQVDFDVVEARSTTRKLLNAFRTASDPLVKKVLKEMAFDALDFENEVRVRSQAKQAVQMLHEIKMPQISKN